MLEFYYNLSINKFPIKAKLLSEELSAVLNFENIKIESANEINIPEIYQGILSSDVFSTLNNIYYTIRKNGGSEHPLLKKYLPESKIEPQSDHLFADFFCGAGGLSQGFINEGFLPGFVNDNSLDALETYYFNHSLPLNRIYKGDIKDLIEDFEKYKNVFKNIKLVIGGPPCQGFSMANRRNFELTGNKKEKRFIEDERNILYKYFVKLIGLINPDYFIMENVLGMMRVQSQIEEDINAETKNQYSFVPLVLDAQNFDIPQNRKRYFLIGSKDFMSIRQIGDTLLAMRTTGSKYKLDDALFGLPRIRTNPRKLKVDYESSLNGYMIRKYKIKQNEYLKGINKGREIPYLFNHKSRYNNNNDLEIFRLLPEGENSLHESIKHLNNYGNRDHIFKDKYYKLRHDEVSKTITSHMKYDCHMYIHPRQARGLSPREAARIQTFSDDYLFRGSLNEWYKQIGNAVPVRLAEIIGNQIMKHC